MKTVFRTPFYIIIALVVSLVFASKSFAQQNTTWDDFVEHFHNSDSEGYYDQELLDDLLDIYNNKLNINTATEEELISLPFLNSSQVKDIIYYRTMNGQFLTLGELMFVTTLDKETRDFLKLFTYAGELPEDKFNIKQLWDNAKNELTLRTDIPLYKQAGYVPQKSNKTQEYEQKAYAGSPLYESIRYNLSSMGHLDIGIIAEKDAGERGIDYINGYAMIKDVGHVRNAIIGNYRVSFGQGLVINNASSFGKTMLTSSIGNIGKGFSKKSSTTENQYMTGGAISLKYSNMIYSAYLSHHKCDGTMNNDSTGISSIKTDGLHRTELERSKKGNISVSDFGGNIQWSKDNLQISATFAFTHYSLPLSPKHNTRSSLYRIFNAHGKDFCSYGISYAYRVRKLSISGETASCNSGGVASLNTLKFDWNSYNTLTFIQRFYSYKYNSINGKCFGENTIPKNEEGIYVGWDTKPSRRIRITSYVDVFYFPWMKYMVSNSSYGIDGTAQVTYSASKNLNFSIRYKIKSKQKDFVVTQSKADTMKVLQYNTNQSLRLTSTFTPTEHITLKSNIMGTAISFGPSPIEYGFAASQGVTWAGTRGRNKINITATYFNTDSYNSRLYAYEPSLLFSFGMKSYYYKGIRLIALLTYQPMHNMTLTGKFGFTHYFNKNTIGSGKDIISANHKEDIQLQMRWKF